MRTILIATACLSYCSPLPAAPPRSPSPAFQQTDCILESLRELADGATSSTRNVQLSAPSACAGHAAIYLDTGTTIDNGGNGSIEFEISGVGGEQQFTFASGTAQISIIETINAFSETIGVSASLVSIESPRLNISSLQSGSAQFVSVVQLNGVEPMVCDQPMGGTCTFRQTDFGEDGVPGDVDCNGVINTNDIVALFDMWGTCDDSTDCTGDQNSDGQVNVIDLLLVLEQWT